MSSTMLSHEYGAMAFKNERPGFITLVAYVGAGLSVNPARALYMTSCPPSFGVMFQVAVVSLLVV